MDPRVCVTAVRLGNIPSTALATVMTGTPADPTAMDVRTVAVDFTTTPSAPVDDTTCKIVVWMRLTPGSVSGFPPAVITGRGMLFAKADDCSGVMETSWRGCGSEPGICWGTVRENGPGIVTAERGAAGPGMGGAGCAVGGGAAKVRDMAPREAMRLTIAGMFPSSGAEGAFCDGTGGRGADGWGTAG